MNIAIAIACFMVGGLFGMGLMCIVVVGEKGEHYAEGKKNK